MDQVQEKPQKMSNLETMKAKTLRSITLVIVLCGSAVMFSPARADLVRRGETKLVSQDANGLPADGGYSDVSDDGRYVAFESWDRLTTEDTDNISDVYIRDMVAGTTSLVSPDIPGVSDGLCNHHPSMSADGTKIIYFASFTSSPGLRINRCLSIVLVFRDLTNGVSKKLSLGATGFVPENARISGDGRWVLVHKDGNYSDDYISVINASIGSIAWTSPAICWGCVIGEPSLYISHTGRFITFRSQRDWVPGDTDADWDIYLHDRDTDQDGIFDEPGAIQTRLGSVLPDGSSPSADQGIVSDDGRYVAFVSQMTRVCIPTTTRCGPFPELSGLYVRDFSTGTSEFITSVTFSPFEGGTGDVLSGNDLTIGISADGRYLALSSNLPLAPGDTNASTDAYIYDRSTRRFTLASILPQQIQTPIHVTRLSISSDGRYLSFNTDLVAWPDVTDLARAVYVRDLFTPCPVTCPEDLIP